MTVETALWILGGLFLPALGWSVAVMWALKSIYRDIAEIKKRLENPEKYGFGTELQSRIIEDNTRAMKELTHYIQWLAKQQLGLEPPPKIGD